MIRRVIIKSKVHPVEVLTVRPNLFDVCNPFINTVPIEMQQPKWIQEIIYPEFLILCSKSYQSQPILHWIFSGES